MWSSSLRLPHQNPASTCPFLHTCYMPCPSQVGKSKAFASGLNLRKMQCEEIRWCKINLSTGSTVPVEPWPPGVCVLSCFSPASDTNFFQIFFEILYLFRGLPTDIFPSGVFLNAFFTFLSCDILSRCLNHLNLRLWFLRWYVVLCTDSSTAGLVLWVPNKKLVYIAGMSPDWLTD